MRHKRWQHLMMPAQPGPHLVMIQADFSFGLFKDGFDSLNTND
jgi:hypothetical protein